MTRRGGTSVSRLLSLLYTERYLRLSLRLLERRTAPVVLEGFGPAGFPATRPGAPLRLGGVPARQHDPITCGAAVALLANAAADRALATWLSTGRAPARATPPELVDLPSDARVEADAARRLALAQTATHRRLTRRALGPLPWPRSLGTPPWTLARDLRLPQVRYAHRPVDDRDQHLMDLTLRMLLAATSAGVPVPLYTGGDTRRGWAAAVPRHVVLALPGPGPQVRIFEPSTAVVHRIDPEDLRARVRPHAALGGWDHLVWVLIPLVRPDSPAAGS